MKIQGLSICDNENHAGWLDNKRALHHFKWNWELLIRPFQFGRQMEIIQKWCEDYNGDATHVLYSDAYDTFALGNEQEVIGKFKEHYGYLKMIVSTESNCYPHPEKAKDYPYIASESKWKFVCAGQFIAEIPYFKELSKSFYQIGHDQVWMREKYFERPNEISIDHECRIFQSIAFENDDDFAATRDHRLLNRKTGTLPVFIHNNGGQGHVPSWVTSLIE